jgi:glutaredoxin
MTNRFVLALCLALLGCPESKPAATTAPNAGPEVSNAKADKEQAAPKPPVITDDSTDLVFSWFDPQKGHATGTRVAEVPKPCRKDVVVADLSRTPEQRQSTRYVMIANLEQKKADGTYSVVVQSRYRFADTDLSDLGPIAKNEGVIVYSTTWCGPCKSLKKWLTAEGVPFTTKDVENDPGAGAEVAAKLKKAGMQPGGVPVIDIAGTMIKGFDQRAIEQALRAPR